jgi:hypothetical protein
VVNRDPDARRHRRCRGAHPVAQVGGELGIVEHAYAAGTRKPGHSSAKQTPGTVPVIPQMGARLALRRPAAPDTLPPDG